MAGGALSVAVLSLVYEGIGIAWLPLLGPAIQEMFKGTPDSYYPRHGTAMDGTKAADEPAYTMLHHGTPGVEGFFPAWVHVKALNPLDLRQSQSCLWAHPLAQVSLHVWRARNSWPGGGLEAFAPWAGFRLTCRVAGSRNGESPGCWRFMVQGFRV